MSKNLNSLKKGKNTFKFYSFSDRISMVNLDIFRSTSHIDQVQAPLEVNETYFLRELEGFKTKVSSNFKHVYRLIRPWSVSLPMIIYHIKDIIKVLIKALDKLDDDVIPAIFSLLAILSRDMRSEFYKYFDLVLKCFIEKIDSWRTNSEQLEALFSNIARQFKYLEKYLLKDIKKVFVLYKDFFLNKKEHIRQFAAESFAYLLRKLDMPRLSEMIDFMISYIPAPQFDDEESEIDRAQLCDGIGHLLFHVVQGIKKKFTTSSVNILPIIFSKMSHTKPELLRAIEEEAREAEIENKRSKSSAQSDELPEDHVESTMLFEISGKNEMDIDSGNQEFDYNSLFLVLQKFIQRCRDHFRHHDAQTLWDAFYMTFEDLLDNQDVKLDKKNLDMLSDQQLKSFGYMSTIVSEWSKARFFPGMSAENQDSIITNYMKLLDLLLANEKLKKSASIQKDSRVAQAAFSRFVMDLMFEFFSLIGTTYCTATEKIDKKMLSSLIEKMFLVMENSPNLVYDFVLAMKGNFYFASTLVGPSLMFLDKQLRKMNPTEEETKTSQKKVKTPKKSIPVTSQSNHTEFKSHIMFLYRLVTQIDWSLMAGSMYVDQAKESIILPSNRLVTQSLEVISDFVSALKSKNDMPSVDHISTVWLTLKTLSFIQPSSDSSLEHSDLTISNLISKLLELNLENSSLSMLLGDALLTRVDIARICRRSYIDQSVTILKSCIDQVFEAVRKEPENWYIKHAMSEIVSLASFEPIDDPSRYLSCKEELLSKKDILISILNQTADLTSHWNVQVRNTSWKLIHSLSLLDSSIEVHRPLVNLCYELAFLKYEPLQYKLLSAKFPDLVELALQVSAKEFDHRLAIRFFVGIFFVQLTPLWEAALKGLNRLSDINSKAYWSVLLPIVQATQAQIGIAQSQVLNNNSNEEQETDDPDAAPETIQNTLFKSHSHHTSCLEHFVEVRDRTDRFTGASSFSETLFKSLCHSVKTLAQTSSTATTLSELFISFTRAHLSYLSTSVDLLEMEAELDDDDEDNTSKKASKKDKASDNKSVAPKESAAAEKSKQLVGEIRKYLLGFLKFFASFKTSAGLKKSETLFELFSKLIGVSNEDIQLTTLDCLCLWKENSYIVDYKEQLANLIVDTRGRVPFTSFPLSEAKTSIMPAHRPSLVPFIIRIIFPKLTLARDDMGRRGAVLAYLAQLNPSELKPLMHLTLGKFEPAVDQAQSMIRSSKSSTPSKSSKSKKATSSSLDLTQISIPDTSLGNLIGSLRMVHDMVKYMGVTIEPYLHEFLTISLCLLNHSQHTSSETDFLSRSSYERTQFNFMRKSAIKNLNIIMSMFDGWDYVPYIAEIHRLLRFESKYLETIDPFEQVHPFLQWCVTVSARPLLIQILKPFVGHFIVLLKRQELFYDVKNALFTIVENLLKVKVDGSPTFKITGDGKSQELIGGLTQKQFAKLTEDEQHQHLVQTRMLKEYQLQEDILLPHSNDLLDAMQIRLYNDYQTKKRKRFGMRELIILEKLTRYATTSDHADKLVLLMLPFTQQPNLPQEVRERILSIFCNMVPLLTDAMMHLETISTLFTRVNTPGGRIQLCKIVEQLSKLDEQLAEISPVLFELNSMSKSRVDEPDYDLRMQAYTKINDTLFSQLSQLQASFIINNYLYFTMQPDISIRNNAAFGLTRIVNYISTQYDQEGKIRADFLDKFTKSSKSANSSGKVLIDASEYDLLVNNQAIMPADNEDSIEEEKKMKFCRIRQFLPFEIVSQTLIPAIQRQVGSSSEIARKEFLSLLSFIVTSFPTQFKDLVPALGDSDDTNFFISIHHLQNFRRIKSLVRLTDLVNRKLFSAYSLMHYFFPVLKRIILSAATKDHPIVGEAIKAITCIAQQLDWPFYMSTIQQCLSGMVLNPSIQNLWIKLLCSLLDVFHFDISREYEDIVKEARPRKTKFVVTSKQQQYTEDADEDDDGGLGIEDETPEQTEMQVDDQKEGESEVQEETLEDAAEQSEDGKVTVEDTEEDEEDEDGGLAEEVEEEDEEEDDDDSMEDHYEDEDSLQRQIQRTVLNSILPALVKLMKTEDKENKALRTNVVVSSVALLNRMPDSIANLYIGRFLIEVANQLASRAFANRISANSAIQEIIKVLGPKKFMYVLDTLIGQLQRGFQLHILSSTLNTLLKTMLPTITPGELDNSIHLLNKVFFEELIGHVAEQKTVKKITSQTQEASKTYAYDSLGMIAQVIEFEKSIRTLLDPYLDVILASQDIKVIRKMKNAIEQISLGIRSNPTASAEKILVFVYQLIDQYSKPLAVQKKEKQTDLEKTFVIEANPYKKGAFAAAVMTGKEVNNDHVIISYALQILFSVIKSEKLDAKVTEHLQMLDPFVPILARFLKNRHDDILTNSLKCLSALLKYSLPSIKGRGAVLAEATIHLIQKANSQSELMTIALKSLARIIDTTDNIKINEALLKLVVGYIEELLETDTPQVALNLFKSIVSKRFLLSEVYDIMKKINQLLVHTKIIAIRSTCESIITTFILMYPLESKRLDQQFEFIMANLTFSEATGRLAILELLKMLFGRLPKDVLNSRVQYFFLPLVAQMINDDNAECRSAASHAIQTLFSKVSASESESLLQSVFKWYENDGSKLSLKRAAVQLIGIFVKAMGPDFSNNHSKRLIPAFEKRIRDIVSSNTSGNNDDEINERDDQEQLIHYQYNDDEWQLVYFTLLCIEKITTLSPSLMLKGSMTPLWTLIASHHILAFTHPWVRMVAARLLGSYFAQRKQQMPINPKNGIKMIPVSATKKGKSVEPSSLKKNENFDWLAESRKLFSIAKLFCDMLESPDLSEELGTQIVKNLYWVGLELQKFPELTPIQQIQASRLITDENYGSDNEDDGEEETEKQEEPTKTAELDDEEQQEQQSEDEMEVDEAVQSSSNQMVDKQGQQQVQDEREVDQGGVPAVAWLFRRISYMTKKLSRLGKTCAFKFFAAMTMSMQPEEVLRYLVFMLFPLFRANEQILANQAIRTAREAAGRPMRPQDAETTAFIELVHEVAEMLRKKVGITAYYEVHEKVRSRVLNVRQRRKSELAVEAVTNPAKYALKKAAKNQKLAKSKKRKIDAQTAFRSKHRIKLRKTE